MAHRLVLGRATMTASFVLAAAFCGASLLYTDHGGPAQELQSLNAHENLAGASFAQTGRSLSRGMADAMPMRERMLGGSFAKVVITLALLLCGFMAHMGAFDSISNSLSSTSALVTGTASATSSTMMRQPVPSRRLRTEAVTKAAASDTPSSAVGLSEAHQPVAAKPAEKDRASAETTDVAASNFQSEATGVEYHATPSDPAKVKEAQKEASRMQDAVRARLEAAKKEAEQWATEEAEEDLKKAAAGSKAIEAYERYLSVPEAMRARLLEIESLTSLGQFLEANGRPTEALGSLRRAVEASSELVPSDSTTKSSQPHSSETVEVVARAEVALARALCAVGGQHGKAFGEAGRYLGMALQSVAHARVGDARHEFAPLAAEIDAELASCSYQEGNLATADSQAEAALKIVNDEIPAGLVKGELLKKVARLRGGVKHDEGSFKDALRLYDDYLEASAATADKEGGSGKDASPPEVMVERLAVLQDKALAMSQDGRIDEGLRKLDEVEQLQQAMKEMISKTSGDDKGSSLDGKLWEEMARLSTTRAELLLYRASTYDTKLSFKARKQATLAVSMLRKGDHKKALGNSLNTLGNVLSAIGRLNEANDAYKESLELLSEVFGSDSPVVASIYDNLGIVAEAAGEPKAGLRFFQYAVGIQERTLGISNPDTATSLTLIAANLEKHSNLLHAEIVVAATKALESAVAAYPEGHATRIEAEERLKSLLKADLTTLVV